jgi:hypothetical protein
MQLNLSTKKVKLALFVLLLVSRKQKRTNSIDQYDLNGPEAENHFGIAKPDWNDKQQNIEHHSDYPTDRGGEGLVV